jgi:membrane-associated progesterone receptor component
MIEKSIDFAAIPENLQEFTEESLSQYNGSDPSLPVYISVMGNVYDVSSKREMYQPGSSYSVFAGKDPSKALGKSSLNINEISSDYSSLNEEEMKVLLDWKAYYDKRYPVIGHLIKK